MAKAEHSAGQARAWQRMLSGRRLDLLDPSPLDIEITDIAHGLARVARWNGQTRGQHAYSVAQHSLLVEQIFSRLAPDAGPDMLMLALLHDAPEYVIGDMISPFKAVMGGQYEIIDARLQNAIHIRFSLPVKTDKKLYRRIKQADRIAAYYEAIRLAGFSDDEAARYFGRPRHMTADGLDLIPRPTQQVEGSFLSRFSALDRSRNKE